MMTGQLDGIIKQVRDNSILWNTHPVYPHTHKKNKGPQGNIMFVFGFLEIKGCMYLGEGQVKISGHEVGFR